MKSRSHRSPMIEHRRDDWLDGSWTVDCVCGVNFDDGEEMVDCDECGVWVHTKCSRYVKIDKSFSCEKCKTKTNFGGHMNDSEETEVAEFLLELPTKTMLGTPNIGTDSSRKAFGLCTDIPMEKRVHVQGESDFFNRSKMSCIFSPQLWKCAGYVPKKFNVRYTEFPCLFEEKNEDDMNKEEGAGALFSLLKLVKHHPRLSFVDPVPEHCPVEASQQDNKSDVENSDWSCHGNSLSEETTSVPVLLDSAKRKMEQQTAMVNDQNVKRSPDRVSQVSATVRENVLP